MRTEPTIDDLRKRLHAKQPRVRRIAIADLLRQATHEALSLAVDHLQVEPDSAIQLRIIGALGEHAFTPATVTLRQFRDNPNSDPQVAHAALIACDRLEQAPLRRDPTAGRASSNAPDES